MQRQIKISDRAADTMAIVPTPLASDLRRCAILLDIDGTILDFAPSPRTGFGASGVATDADATC